jgi:histidine ammonia-lyase
VIYDVGLIPDGLTRAPVPVGPEPLDISDIVAVARFGAGVRLTPAAEHGIALAREAVDALAAQDRPVYGLSTGFGALDGVTIPPADRARLQQSLIRSHVAGAGPEVEREVVRAMMLMRLHTLATGRTGVRVETARAYAAVLSAGITPIVQEYGSLGCSGDLAPLSAAALTLMGEGEVRDVDGVRRPAADALAQAGIAPVVLAEKEGLALINGTDGMLGMLVMAVHDLRLLLRTADVVAAISVEALVGRKSQFAADLMALRPHPGQGQSASNLREMLVDSPILAGRAERTGMPVQDAYSLRCTPQVHGAARDTLEHAATVAARELASSIDNPVVTADGRLESTGNFHGAPLGYVLDFLAIAVADVASISERRTDRLLDRTRSAGLPAFLADHPGLDSGLMIAQYTSAGIVAELKRLAAPASVDSIPSSAMKEDHVSLGWHAARKLRRAIDGLAGVLGIELLCGSRGVQLRRPLACAPATRAVLAALDDAGIRGPGPDRHLAPEIETMTELVRRGDIAAAAESCTGPLN